MGFQLMAHRKDALAANRYDLHLLEVFVYTARLCYIPAP